MKFSVTFWTLCASIGGKIGLASAYTDAPDLIRVENVRPGSNTRSRTLIDFVFDELATVKQCCNLFKIIPADGSDPIEAAEVQEPNTPNTTFTVVFPGALSASNLHRGIVELGVMRSEATGILNPPQAARVSGGAAGTVHPDLVSVAVDGDQMIFRFDEPIDKKNDIIEDTSALRFYTKTGEVFTSIAVKPGYDSYSVRAIYQLQGITLKDAVGGFVTPGNIVGDPNSNDQNELDVYFPVEDTGLVVCEPSPSIGSTGDSSGPTEAPDLLEVNNFRRGPFTAKFEPTTCVDFVFDQAAYVNGGKKSDFGLIPINAGQVVPGSSEVILSSDVDVEGDTIVTVAIAGDVIPEDFARGYVSNGVVNSDCCSINADFPTSMAQSRPISPNTRTNAPEISKLERDGDTFLFTFNKALTETVPIDNGGFQIFFPAAKAQQSIPVASSSGARRVDDFTARVFFNRLPENYMAKDAVGASIQKETVQAADQTGTANDGKNAFDMYLNIEVLRDQFCEPSPDIGGSGSGSGPTEAPDLISVNNFRQGPYTIEFEPTTCVDFVFDQPAFINGGKRSDFGLLPATGAQPFWGSSEMKPPLSKDPSGDNIITIIFPGLISPSDYARGIIDVGIVNDDCCRVDFNSPFNAKQTDDISPERTTDNPDLVAVTNVIDSPSLMNFTFDQEIKFGNLDNANDKLCVYFPGTATTANIPVACAENVRGVNRTTLEGQFSTFPEAFTLSDAVGAYIQAGAVEALNSQAGLNQGRNGFHEISF